MRDVADHRGELFFGGVGQQWHATTARTSFRRQGIADDLRARYGRDVDDW